MQYSSQPHGVAMAMTQSDADTHFDSEAFKAWQKARDNDTQLLKAINDGINNLIRALSR